MKNQQIGRRVRQLSAALVFAMAGITGPSSAQDDKVVARVDGVEITAADVDVAAEFYGARLDSIPADARLSLLVDVLIDMKLAANAARTANLTEDEGYKRRMAFFDGQTLHTLLLDREVAKRVDDAAVRRAYDEHIAGLPKVEEIRISHILVATEAEAVAIIDAIKAGADFASLAKEKSLDQSSRENGGDLGFAATGAMMAELEAAIAGLAAGVMADHPVASPFGFHVVKLEERRIQPPPAFEVLAPQIRPLLEQRAAQEFLAELKAAATVEKLVPDVDLPKQDDGHGH
ncbi:MAG: peptidylprolyl isomerase [Rhizobiaceae bacterium]|nr:peptidylprolyl isomerase [Rhizobiaceae bacterium]